MRLVRRVSLAALIVVSQIFAACSEESAPEPEPWTGAVTLTCHTWQPQKPDAFRMIADVALGEDPEGPSAAELQRLKAHGAEILHTFNVPLARVDMPVDSVEAMEREWSIAWAEGVSFPDLYLIHGLVLGFTHPIEQADYAFLASKNVHIEKQFGNTLIITVQDDSIPSLRSPDNEWYIELDYWFCGDQTKLK